MNSRAVTARNLVLGYGAQLVMTSSDFDIPVGQTTAIIGPNGSGKSTLLNALAGLLRPVSGSLVFQSGEQHGSRCAYVLQTTKVNEALPVTVREVVNMGRYSATGWFRPLTAADRAAVTEAMNRTGVTHLASRQLHELSGGQRQRVYVAQGLVQEQDLLLLDEPLTGIDLPAALAIDRLIHEETEQGRTVILTTHDLSEARAADHVILLAGRVVAEGVPAEVLTSEKLLSAYASSLVHGGAEAFQLDDAAHRPADKRHIHRQLAMHPEADPSHLHRD